VPFNTTVSDEVNAAEPRNTASYRLPMRRQAPTVNVVGFELEY
jgi:hypothetical protein